MTIVDFINALPDDVRRLEPVFTTIRLVAALFGLRTWEDGSMSP
jgi:hypothetical protein